MKQKLKHLIGFVILSAFFLTIFIYALSMQFGIWGAAGIMLFAFCGAGILLLGTWLMA